MMLKGLVTVNVYPSLALDGRAIAALERIATAAERIAAHTEEIMASIEEIQTQLLETNAALDRTTAALVNISVDIANLEARIEELIAAGGATSAQLDTLLAEVSDTRQRAQNVAAAAEAEDLER